MSTLTVDHPSLRRTATPAAVALALAALLAAPAFLVGQALLPPLPADLAEAVGRMREVPAQLLAARLVTALGAFCFVAAVHLVVRLVPAGVRGRALTMTGATLASIGTFFNGLSQVTQGYATAAALAPPVDPASGEWIVGSLGTGLVDLPIGYWSVPVFALGMVTLALGAAVSRRVPLWMPALLVVGVVLAVLTAGTGAVVAFAQLPVVVGLGGLVLRALRVAPRP